MLADVRTFGAFGFQGVAAVTSVTFQNAERFSGAVHQTGEDVRAQVLPLLADFRIVCSKTGMLPTREVVMEVARLFRETDLPRPVVDPVILSSTGYRLMEEKALDTFVKELLPLARLVTPNISEAETLTGITITSEADMRRAASIIRQLGAPAVLIKGGHLGLQSAVGSRQSLEEEAPGSEDAVDVLDDEGKVKAFREKRVRGAELHGSGCILSAAIAAGLGKGMNLEDSVAEAKRFVLQAIRDSRLPN